MDNAEKFAHWEDIALYDLETAEAMSRSGRYLYVVFMCQQAIEKLSKGLYVYFIGLEANRSHNINVVLKPLFEEEAPLHVAASTFNEQYSPFFAELLAYYISERYPSYRERLSTAISREKAEDVLRRTKEAFEWLQSLKK